MDLVQAREQQVQLKGGDLRAWGVEKVVKILLLFGSFLGDSANITHNFC